MAFVADLIELVATSSDPLHSCPETWPRVPLRSVCSIINGYPFQSRFFGGSGVPILRIRDILPGKSETYYSGPVPEGYWVERGDLVVGMDGDFNTKRWRGDRALLNQRVCKLIPDEENLCSAYLSYVLPGYLQLINENTPSVTVKHLSSRTLGAIPIPLPPLDLQRRIVSRINELLTDIEDGELALAKARDDLGQWHRSLLHAAVAGELTGEWRRSNPAPEAGQDLLVRLLADRRRRLTGGNRSAKRYVEPTHPDASTLPTLPVGWVWTTVEAAGDVLLGRQRSPAHHAGDHMRPYLRVANVLEGRLDLRDVKWMNFTPAEFEIFSLKPGDVLLNEGQAPELLGRPAIYRGEIEGCCFQKTLLRFRPSPAVLPEFALIVFRHYMHSGRFQRESRITTNIAHLTQVRFLPMEFPVPPLAEQHEIVARVAAAETAWASEILNSEIASQLRQSILAAAFRGELAA